MRKPVIMLIALMVLMGCATVEIPASPEMLKYSQTRQAPLERPQLFSKIMTWIAVHYNDANNVIKYQDKDEGRIVCRGAFLSQNIYKFRHGTIMPASMFYNVVIQVENGSYTINFQDYVGEAADYDGNVPITAEKHAIEISAHVRLLESRLYEYVAGNP